MDSSNPQTAIPNPQSAIDRTLVIIPHYGPDALVRELLESAGVTLGAHTFDRDITIIEQREISFLIVNNNKVNRGFTAACNLGLRRISERSSDLVFAWVLNNDTAFEARAQFEQALLSMQALSRDRNWAIVAQQVRHYADRDRIVFGGALECFPAGRHKSGFHSAGDWRAPSEEKWLSFCSVLIRRDLVLEIGLMDESFVNYYSDSDYSLRARAAGQMLGYSGETSHVFHKIGQSAYPSEEQQRVLRHDYLAFWKKWLGGPEHRTYLRLMRGASGSETAGSLRERARYPDLCAWLETLPADQPIALLDIVQHFKHQAPVTSFSILSNITCELVERCRS